MLIGRVDKQLQTLTESIEEGVSKGVPLEFISYSLYRNGWPNHSVDLAVRKWQSESKKIKSPPGFSKWLKKYYKEIKPAIALMVVLNMLGAAILLLQPWPLQILIDSVFGGSPAPGPLRTQTHTPNLILIVALFTVGIFLLGQAFNFINNFILINASDLIDRSLQEESFRHVLHLPLFHEARLGDKDYVNRQRLINGSLSDLILNSTSEIIGDVFLIIGILVIMMIINPELTFIAVITIPLLIVTTNIFRPLIAKWQHAYDSLDSDSNSLIKESIKNAETIQAYALEERQVSDFKDLGRQYYQVNKKNLALDLAYSFTNGLIVVIASALIIYIGGKEALNNSFTLGHLVVFLIYLGYLVNPVRSIANQYTLKRLSTMNVRRTFEVIKDHEGIEYLRQNKPLVNVRGQIVFDNVSFVKNNKPVLDQVSLSIAAGTKVGFIGDSGSGKTALLRLLDLYIEPTSGHILIDGHDIQSVSLGDLRRSITWVSQPPELFSSSISDNIRDGDINRYIQAEEIAEVSRASNISEFSGDLDRGLDSVTHNTTPKLNASQRQRLNIARALIKRAPIVCIDEPLRALDDNNEQLVHEAIINLTNGKTVLLASDNPNLLGLMDQVFVIDQGKIRNVNELGGIDHYLRSKA